MSSAFQVRILPLIKGVPGTPEDVFGGQTSITLEDTVEVTQFYNLEVNHQLNEPRSGSLELSMWDTTPAAGSEVEGSLVASLEPFAFAVQVGYIRPGNTVAEIILCGPAKAVKDYEAGRLKLVIYDPAYRCQNHYIRRGDVALNLPDDRGRLRSGAGGWIEGSEVRHSIDDILAAARNTPEQQDREVPVLGIDYFEYGDFLNIDDRAFITFERGRECWSLIEEISRAIGGPDIDLRPREGFPIWYYASLECYEAPTDPDNPGELELGRNLVPVDLDDPQPGEVIFDYGLGLGNLRQVIEDPGRPTTHSHVLDSDSKYRVTSADADSSAEIGVWTDWTQVPWTITRRKRGHTNGSWTSDVEEADLTSLQEVADATVRAYGRPPKFFTCVLHPDDVQPYHYGYQWWDQDTVVGDFYIGDYVHVRAQKGFCQFATTARITGVKFTQAGGNGLPQVHLSMIPAVGGTASSTEE